jgi:hypothetical protein
MWEQVSDLISMHEEADKFIPASKYTGNGEEASNGNSNFVRFASWLLISHFNWAFPGLTLFI